MNQPETNLAVIAPTALTLFDKMKAQMATFIGPTKDVIVTDKATDILAQGALKTLNDFKKVIEENRVTAKKPHLDACRQIDEYAQDITKPLTDAINGIKDKRTAWTDAENVRIAAERRKLEEEQRELERKARAEQERQIAEERKAHEAAQAALKKQQEAERAAFEKEQQKKLERRKAFGLDEEKARKDKEAAERAMQEKAEADRRAAAQRAEQARLETQARLEREQKEQQQAMAARQKALEAEKPKGTRQVPKWEVVDAKLIPAKYWMLNDTLIGQDVRGGIPAIPGIKITMETVAIVTR